MYFQAWHLCFRFAEEGPMTSLRPLRVAVAGAGFWARFQTAAWRELPEIELVAICDPDRQRAQQLAAHQQIGHVFTDPGEMLEAVRPDLFDIISSVPSHAPLVKMAADRQIPVVCQKPMTDSYAGCRELVDYCDSRGVFFAVHENWRWQRPLRLVRELLQQGCIGHPFRAQIDFVSGFDVFANQPALQRASRFVLADIGCHLLDAARSLFGEVRSVDCQTHRIDPEIVGEQVATCLLRMEAPLTVTIHIAYARAPMEDDPFPETLMFVEGSAGTLSLRRGGEIRVTTAQGTMVHDGRPSLYPWINPQYAVVQSSIVDCHADIVDALRTGRAAATSAADNLKTMRLMEAAYESAASDCVVPIDAGRA
jgi:predicted dehydrogenase